MTKILSVATANVSVNQLEDRAHKYFPRTDYLELEDRLTADTIDYSTYDGGFSGDLVRWVEKELRSDVYLAFVSWLVRRKYSTVFTWSERAGIPFAGFERVFPSNVRLVTMFQCWSKRQETTIKQLGLFSVMDRIIVHCSSMKDRLIDLGAPAASLQVIHYSIDQDFFSPQLHVTQEPGTIASVGETRSRDYYSLIRAVENLPARLEIAGHGHWFAREKNNALTVRVPNNVSLRRRLSYDELRSFYARSSFVVLPIHDLVYSAGATTALEAGSVGRAVIAYRSRGITEYVVDGETGILVEPGDISGLRDAISHLLANPTEAKRLGANARQRILENFRLETYVQNIADVLQR